MSMDRITKTGIVSALAAAFLFGVTTPVAKVLLTDTGPVILAGLLYLGAGVVLLIYRKTVLYLSSDIRRSESKVSRSEIPCLAGAVVAGGILGPVLLMTGLTSLPAGTASLMLNGELVITLLLAVLLFHEPVDRRTISAILLVLVGGVLISWDPDAASGFSYGAVLILLACFAWAIDNNLTRRIADKDPTAIVMVKGLSAGTVTVLIGLLIGESLPVSSIIPAILIVGAAGFGLSLLLFIYGLRSLGTTRTVSLFATAPFIGLITAPGITGEMPGLLIIAAGILMAGGVLMILTESHNHLHLHRMVTHDHRHSHEDGHHDHLHDGEHANWAHAHTHIHDVVEHVHPHTPDTHHFHEHVDMIKDDK